MSKEIKTTVLEENELEVWDEELGQFVINYPSSYYIINSLGQSVFYHCRSRADAQRACDETYGKGFYTVRQAKGGKGSGEVSARGTTSRRGTASHLRKTV